MRGSTSWVVIAGILLLTAVGCTSDDPTGTVLGGFLDPPHEPDALMTDFERAYAEMDIDAYENVLHEDYKFVFIDHAVVWQRHQDIQSTSNMFGGQPGHNPDGSYRPPVQSIAIDTLIRQTPWEDVPADDPDFPDSEKALYQTRLVLTLEGGEHTLTVQSDQYFFVKPEQVDPGDGTTETRYFLYGHMDLLGGGGKAFAELTWGDIKVMFF